MEGIDIALAFILTLLPIHVCTAAVTSGSPNITSINIENTTMTFFEEIEETNVTMAERNITQTTDVKVGKKGKKGMNLKGYAGFGGAGGEYIKIGLDEVLKLGGGVEMGGSLQGTNFI